MSARLLLAFIAAALLLGACATDTVVLLPREDGSTGAIAASRNGAEVVLPIIFLFGAYVIVNGHLSAGGGFQGGQSWPPASCCWCSRAHRRS